MGDKSLSQYLLHFFIWKKEKFAKVGLENFTGR
jgi:hypothetical protein